MSVAFTETVATLTDVVGVDDAEPLAQWLRTTLRPRVKLAGCTHLHTSALQALLAAQPTIASALTDPFLARWVGPLLASVLLSPVPASESA